MSSPAADDHGDPSQWYWTGDGRRGASLGQRLDRSRGAIAFLGPWVVGLALGWIGGWRFAAGLEAGAMVALAIAGLSVLVLMRRNDPALRRHPARIDFTRHRWLWVPLIIVLSGVGMVRATLVIADWLVPPDQIAVTIQRETFSRWSSEYQTDHGYLQSPFLTSVAAHPGPAVVSVGHFSRELLFVEQPAR